MVSCLLKCDWILSSLSYNETWRLSRRLLAKHFSRSSTGSKNSVLGFADLEWQRPHVIKYTRHFLQSLLQTPDSFMDHTFTYSSVFSGINILLIGSLNVSLAGSVSLSSTYGLDIAVEDDQYIGLVRKAIEGLSLAVVPGRFFVDTFPLLRFLPDWVPFKKQAKVWREDLKAFLDVPFHHAKENLAIQNGYVRACFLVYLF